MTIPLKTFFIHHILLGDNNSLMHSHHFLSMSASSFNTEGKFNSLPQQTLNQFSGNVLYLSSGTILMLKATFKLNNYTITFVSLFWIPM